MEITFKIGIFYLDFYSAHDHFSYQAVLSKSDFSHCTEFGLHPIYLSAFSSSTSNLCVHTLLYKYTACNGYSSCSFNYVTMTFFQKVPPLKLAIEPSSHSSYYLLPSHQTKLQFFLRSSEHSRAS